MIIIGEKLNSTLKAVRPAIAAYDAAAIQALAKAQAEAGAAYIDVNAGMFHEDEAERLCWLVQTVQEVTDLPLSLDSPNAKAMEAALQVAKGTVMLNSITDEKDRFEAVLPLAVQYKAKIVALCMDDTGMPETAEERFAIAERLIAKLTAAGIPEDDIYIDPLVRPVSTGPHYGVAAIETIRRVKSAYPDVHIACGLSNISYGIPCRKLVNQAFLVAAMAAGMDGAILDPLDKKMMSLIAAAEALLGIDEYCMDYLEKYRDGLIEA
ncbi:MAG: dihydropteroate synthase [Oscillospiraceae bacterium]|jgi:5-methyltetrahydrofolate--homocysteine methyltransferase|nr:dihydropteroate synthase [Oscillospiraceae bacterium]